ncbi:hypothetical protein [uncultured Thalassospira sp.]|uniref:hypothetical protein n=1 Tax=uncultured Thalassospira sp. TaxID=404382 RepID=UPI00258EA338|nr:hypothetical protein [uncultured Thalassospira sp.]
MLSRLCFALVMTASLTACVTDGGPTDVKGRSLKIDDKGSFTPTESRFNTFAFLKPSSDYITDAKQRNNGQGWMETIIWDSGRSFITIEFINIAWFSDSNERRFANVDIFTKLAKKFPVSKDDFVELDVISPRTKGYFAQNDKCIVGSFTKRFKGPTPYDNDRGLPDAVVEFGTCGDKFSVSPEEFIHKIDLITEDDKKNIASAFSNVNPLPGAKKLPLTTINGSWAGLVDEFSGSVTRETAAQVEFNFSLPDESAQCTGTAVNAQKTTLTGRWELECTNGLHADGIWTNRPGQNFVASGSDTEKRRVQFELRS